MNHRNNLKQTADLPMPPYLYGRQTDFDNSSEDQRIPLYSPETEYATGLEVLKESDPDSYRMVIYSWA